MKKLILLSSIILGLTLFFSSCEKVKVENSNSNLSILPPQASNSTIKKSIIPEKIDLAKNNFKSTWTQFHDEDIILDNGYTNLGSLDRVYFESYEFKFIVQSQSSGYFSLWGEPNFSLIDVGFTGNSTVTLIVTDQDIPINETQVSIYPYSDSNGNNFSIDIYYRPKSWSQIQSRKGIKLYHKIGTDHYVQEINLKEGATLKLKEGSDITASASTPSPNVTRRDLDWYWEPNIRPDNVFSVTNCQFFDWVKRELSFPVKDSGIIKSCGFETDNWPKKKFGINGDEAWIVDYNNNGNISYNYVSNNLLSPLAFVGYQINTPIKNDEIIGRTMIGVRDRDGDIAKETIYILTTSNATKQEAYNILKNEFSSSDVLILDGGSSSQMTCNGIDYVDSGDNIPSVMYAIGG